jgi:hypothetical protein
VLGHQLGQHLVLGLDLRFQKLDRFLFGLMVLSALALESSSAVFEELFLPTVEYRWLQPSSSHRSETGTLVALSPAAKGLKFCR